MRLTRPQWTASQRSLRGQSRKLWSIPNETFLDDEEGSTRGIVRRLSLADWWLLGTVTAAQLVAGTALRIMSLAAWRLRAARWRSIARFVVRGSNERIAWAIEASGRRLGSLSTCLTRALVAELVMDADGEPMILTIGVRRTAAGAFHAHAWLAREGRVLIGATTDEYLPMASWTGLPR